VVDIFDEVSEELRAERAQRLLMRYGGLIFAACVAVIAAGGAWQGWHWWQARQDMAAARDYVALMTSSEAPNLSKPARDAAISAFDVLASSSPNGYRTLARLRSAALKADGGDLQGALAVWDHVAGDSAADPLLRDLASLIWAQRQIDQGDPAVLAARLKPIAAADNPWHSLAQEQLALLDLRQAHDEAAKASLRKLSEDVTAPSGVRGRASALLSRLGG
jgi:hypothetical protein